MTVADSSLSEALRDRYLIERELGRGGMATVYLARDLRHERLVALKVLHPELAASIGPDRFLREIRLTARLDHPHILPLLDSGATGGFLYYVMPYVEGESLRDRLHREIQLPVQDSVRIASEVADALDYAHRHGVIHRDIKPENILLGSGHARVADFGVARAVEAAGADKLTGTGMAVGTPTYMSPEQASGEGHLDGRSDIYAVGCVLYEMLVGEPPFTGPTPQAVIAKRFAQPASRIGLLRDAVPPAVEETVARALARTPADRFSTAAQFIEGLARPTEAPSDSRRVDTQAPPLWSRARRWRAVGGVLVLFALGSTVWVISRSSSRPRPLPVTASTELDPHRIAVLYFDDLSRSRELGHVSDGLTEALIDELSQVRALEVISSNGVLPFRRYTVTPDSIARALRVGTLVSGSVEEVGDQLHTTVRLIDGASGADFRRASFATPVADLLTARDSLTEQVSRFLRERLGEEFRVRRQSSSTSNPQAWALLQRAELLRKRADSAAFASDTVELLRAFRIADSLLAQGEALDQRWVEPIVLRGTIAYRQSRRRGGDPEFARPWIERGLAHASRALAIEPRNPDALELRGILRYWKWLLRLEADPSRANQLRNEAQVDLESATQINPTQAGAWSALSHLYNLTSGAAAAKLAALRAYEADAYLSSADQILWRLFVSSFDLAQFPDGERWCKEGQRRFPGSHRFLECQLLMLLTPIVRPDPEAAWELIRTAEKIAPAGSWPFQRRKYEILVAGVLARAGHSDSARRVLDRIQADSTIDPVGELPFWEAVAYTFLRDHDGALKSLETYVAARPEVRKGEVASDSTWIWRSLRQDPRFKGLFGGRQP